MLELWKLKLNKWKFKDVGMLRIQPSIGDVQWLTSISKEMEVK